MVHIPGGTFTMGSSDGEADESPQRAISMSSFSIDQYEVTFAQYDSCVKKGVCTPAHYDDGNCFISTGSGFQRVVVPHQLRGNDLPVVCVTWAQASKYCAWKKKRLPTEAEWEYAARAGQDSRYAWGDDPPTGQRVAQPSEQKPRSPGRCAPNGWQVYDMTGNVWEWTASLYEKDYYTYADSVNPTGPFAGRYRVLRGGGWYSGPEQLRVTNRHWFEPSSAEVSVGFRCAQ